MFAVAFLVLSQDLYLHQLSLVKRIVVLQNEGFIVLSNTTDHLPQVPLACVFYTKKTTRRTFQMC